MTAEPSVTITQVDRYKFTIDFGQALPALTVDEAVPIGQGEGPFPEQLLIGAVANCLCASLVFALNKFKQDSEGIGARATCRVGRNREGRLRIEGVDVAITLGTSAASLPRIDRVIEQFERFCTVSESVKTGIPVAVSVHDRDGACLKDGIVRSQTPVETRGDHA